MLLQVSLDHFLGVEVINLHWFVIFLAVLDILLNLEAQAVFQRIDDVTILHNHPNILVLELGLVPPLFRDTESVKRDFRNSLAASPL